MRFRAYLPILTILTLISQTTALQFYLDDTCYGPPTKIAPAKKVKFEHALTETFDLARRAHDRLLVAKSGTLVALYFERIFKTGLGDRDAVDKVLSVLHQIGSTKRTIQQTAANIRIYCDNDAMGPGKRWTLVPDAEARHVKGETAAQAQIPNSKRPKETQQWEDKGNGMWMSSVAMSCKSVGEVGLMHHVAYLDSEYERHERNRTTISICDEGLQYEKPGFIAATGEVLPKDQGTVFADLNSYLFRHMTSMTIFHEMTHFRGTEILDQVIAPGKPAYGWTNILKLSKKDALLNAENYTYFVMLIKLSDIGFQLTDAGFAKGVLHRVGTRPNSNVRPVRVVRGDRRGVESKR